MKSAYDFFPVDHGDDANISFSRSMQLSTPPITVTFQVPGGISLKVVKKLTFISHVVGCGRVSVKAIRLIRDESQ
jgi:hypothetical protein